MGDEFKINSGELAGAISSYKAAAEEFKSIVNELNGYLGAITSDGTWKARATGEWTSKVEQAQNYLKTAQATLEKNEQSLTEVQAYAEEIESQVQGQVSSISF